MLVKVLSKALQVLRDLLHLGPQLGLVGGFSHLMNSLRLIQRSHLVSWG